MSRSTVDQFDELHNEQSQKTMVNVLKIGSTEHHTRIRRRVGWFKTGSPERVWRWRAIAPVSCPLAITSRRSAGAMPIFFTARRRNREPGRLSVRCSDAGRVIIIAPSPTTSPASPSTSRDPKMSQHLGFSAVAPPA